MAVAAAAVLLGRPVKWIEDRSENLMVGGQAREERVDVEAAVDADGRLLAVRLRLVLDQGAYPQVGYPATGYSVDRSGPCSPRPTASSTYDLRVGDRRHQQGHLRALPGPVGDRDLGP